jgi:TetR/AcrR family transcriptional regulator, transcriptional repressor for nem operon
VGHSKKAKAASHDRVVGMAAVRFREAGVDGIGVADLMKEAGLTHGGFYRHFASRDALVAEAVERALREGGSAMEAIALALDDARPGARRPSAAARRKRLRTLVDAYLSAAHRDNLGTSCAVTTLAGDVARSTARTRSAYTRQVEVYVDLLLGLITGKGGAVGRMKAITALATMVGAVSLARAVNDKKLSQEILASAADQLKAQLA